MTGYRISCNLPALFAFSFACCHSVQTPEIPGVIWQGNNVLSIALHQHLRVQMNLQSGHKGLHFGSIRNESLINVRNECFRWSSVGHKAQFAREGWTKSLGLEAGEIQGGNGICVLTKVMLLILHHLSSHPKGPRCCPEPLEGWKTAPEQNNFIPNPPLEQFNGKWGGQGELEPGATPP